MAHTFFVLQRTVVRQIAFFTYLGLCLNLCLDWWGTCSVQSWKC